METLDHSVECPASMQKAGSAAGPTPLPSQTISSLNTLTFVHIASPRDRKRPENKKTVRTHAIREAHRVKRLAETTAFAQFHNRILGAKSGSRREGVHVACSGFAHDNEPHSNGAIGICNQIRPALPYLNNSIPYSYFALGGPVLYLNPSTWPFSRPFSMPGVDPKGRFDSIIFPRQSIWMPSVIADTLIVKGPFFQGEVLLWISRSPECFAYRVELINWVQSKLTDPAGATDNATIGSIMTLTMWEDGEGSSLDLVRHMDGLERIINLKGGLIKMQASGPNESDMAAKIVLFDYIIAISCATAPRFPALHSPRPRYPNSNFTRDGLFAASPLYGNGDFSDIRCTSHRDEIVALLQTMWKLTSQAVGEKICPFATCEGLSTFVDASTTRNRLEGITDNISCQEHSKGAGECEVPEKSVLDVLRIASIIHCRALSTPPVHFSAPANIPLLRLLYDFINVSAPDPFWLRYPGILLWVLLIGCAAAVKRRERSYFMMYLAKVGIFTEPRCWFEAQSAILRFIEVQNTIKGCL